MKTSSPIPAALILILVADVAALVALPVVFPALSLRLREPSGANALLVSLTFALFCLGVYGVRRLEPLAGADGEWTSRGRRTGLAVFFALLASLALAWQMGFFRSGLQVDTRDLGEGGSASYFVFGPGAWLGISMVYVLVLAFTVRASVALSWRWFAWAGFGLLAANGMLLLLSAQAGAMILASDGNRAVWLSLSFACLLLLFAPPRLVYLARVVPRSLPFYLGLASLLIVIAACTLALIWLPASG